MEQVKIENCTIEGSSGIHYVSTYHLAETVEETFATIPIKQLKLLYLVAGAAERLVMEAYPLQEQLDPETFEVTAWNLFKLRDAMAILDVEESKSQSENNQSVTI